MSQSTDTKDRRYHRPLTTPGSHWPEWLALIVFAECWVAARVAAKYNIGPTPWFDYYLLWIVPAAAIYLGTFLVWLARSYRRGEDRPIARILSTVRAWKFRAVLETVVPIAVIPPFMTAFTVFKVSIGHVTPYWADPLLMKLDGAFGFQPWQLTHTLFGPLGTYLIDRGYLIWFVVTQAMLFGVLFVPALWRYRAQVVLTFTGVWIIVGTVLAMALPSVGPCFYSYVHAGDPYGGLMARLAGVDRDYHLISLMAQHKLWLDRLHNSVAIGAGISAMPSMHVAMATLTGLLLGRMGWAWLGWLWVGMIWLGSIHLGWHYATDGIVAALLTVVIWQAVAKLLYKKGMGPDQWVDRAAPASAGIELIA